MLDIFERRIFDAPTGHLQHFFDERWRVKSDSYTFGHDIEASWLLCEAAEAIGNPAALARVRELAGRLARAVFAEGLEADGGLCYEGRGGTVIDRKKECWPQAEAAVGFLNAYRISGEEDYLRAALCAWDFIEDCLVDRVYGEWFWRITPEGRAGPDAAEGQRMEGAFHGTRACLETLRRLAALRNPPRT